VTDKKDRNILEAFMEATEAAVDFATESEAIKAVPVVGTALKLLKGADDLRSRALRKKLRRFLSEPSLLQALAAQDFKDDILQSTGRAKEIGEALFLILDKVTDMAKPALLAKCFASFLDGKVQSFQFEALAHAIDLAFIHDLEVFHAPDHASHLADWQSRLTAVGFMKVKDEAWNGSQTYEATTLGKAYLFCLSHSDWMAARTV
jgi:hypothetical protein